MRVYELSGTIRTKLGKKANDDLRKQGMVPCALYNKETLIHFYAAERDFQKLVYTPLVQSVKITIDGKSYDAIVQEVQYHPVKDNIIHADFFVVKDDRKVVIDLPIKLVGASEGVRAGGKMQLNMRRLRVKGLLKHMPEELEINVDNLGLGQGIRIGQLKFENLELMGSKNLVVAAVQLTRAAKGMIQEAAAAAQATDKKGDAKAAAPAAKAPAKK